jgi:hypothetical protein
MGKFKGPVEAKPIVDEAPKRPAGKFKGYAPPAAAAKAGMAEYGPAQFLSELLHNFNDSLTFGLYDKGVDAIQGGHANQDITENSNPVTKIAGQTMGGVPLGLGVSHTLGALIPALARNEIPAIMGNGAVTSGLLSGTDQMVREGKIDPLRLAIDTAGGGVLSGLVGAGSRMASSGARVRAKGTRLTEADKGAAATRTARAKSVGIDLTVPEAVQATKPGAAGSLLAADATATRSPRGSEVAYEFDQARRPHLVQAGRDVVDQLGPGVDPIEAAATAGTRINDVGAGFQRTAKPYYDSAGTKKVAPSWGKKILRDEPYVNTSARAVAKDKDAMLATSQDIGRPVKINDVAFLDAVDKHLKDEVSANAAKPNKSARLAHASETVRTLIDHFAPEHAVGRDIAGKGKDAVAALEAGPLGTISKTANTKTQGSALFGATDESSLVNALDAIDHLPGDTARGILANHVDSAVTSNPQNWARDVLPNRYSVAAASKAAGNRMPHVARILDAARAVGPEAKNPHDFQPSGVFQVAYDLIRHFGQKGVAQKLRDPKWIAKLGQMGPLQELLTQLAPSVNRTASKMREKH